MSEPRYTREEWEEIQAREDEEAEERARQSETGVYVLSLAVANADFKRQPSRKAFENLLDTKLKQAKLRIMEAFYDDE